jgi:hypothetical protein
MTEMFIVLLLCMSRILLLLLLALGASQANAADSLQVSLNKNLFIKGDTIDFTCIIPEALARKMPTATLNVWIEDIGRNKRWRYRYPVLNGEVSASLAVGEHIADGRYAINFLLQPGFFKMMGEVLDHEKKDTSLNYIMVVKNKKGSYLDNAHVSSEGQFKLKSTLFVDSAYFVFSYPKKERLHDLRVKIETPLDSFFTPVLSATRFIDVGKPAEAFQGTTDTGRYTFNTEEPIDKTLPDVVVNTTTKKKIQQFNEENSRGLFQRDDAMIFDGLDSEEIAKAFTLYQFLQAKVPGLIIERDSTGQEYARWRDEVAEVYVDEFKMDIGDHVFVSPADIAMIKVYRPPANISMAGGGAGAIAIYTKNGKWGTKKSEHNFVVKGYTAMDSKWQ